MPIMAIRCREAVLVLVKINKALLKLKHCREASQRNFAVGAINGTRAAKGFKAHLPLPALEFACVLNAACVKLV